MKRARNRAGALSAEEVMTSPVTTLRETDRIRHAAAVLLEKGISGAPVLDGRGRPVGVLTKTDIARYERDHLLSQDLGGAEEALRTLGPLEAAAQGVEPQAEVGEEAVSKWMTPKVIAVKKSAPVAQVAGEMMRRRIHRVFVKDGKTGRLVGVITSFDLLRLLEKLLN